MATPHLVLAYFALANILSWTVWSAMIAFSIKPSLGPTFSMSPGYYLIFLVSARRTELRCAVPDTSGVGEGQPSQLLTRLVHRRMGIWWHLIVVGGPLILALVALGCTSSPAGEDRTGADASASMH